MVVPLILAFAIGFVSGLRTFTSVAAEALVFGNTGWKVAGVVFALGEYVVDMLPAAPSRTRPGGVGVRLVSGAFVGYTIAGGAYSANVHGPTALAGLGLGAAGALAGTYGGHAARIAAIARIGAIPAALAEDVVAIALAALIVTR